MTAEEFVAKYGITGGAESVKDEWVDGVFYRTYELRFVNGNHDEALIRQRRWGDYAFTVPPLTPSAYIASLADSYRAPWPTVKVGTHLTERLRSSIEGGFTVLCDWMGAAMWADFISIPSSH